MHKVDQLELNPGYYFFNAITQLIARKQELSILRKQSPHLFDRNLIDKITYSYPDYIGKELIPSISVEKDVILALKI